MSRMVRYHDQVNKLYTVSNVPGANYFSMGEYSGAMMLVTGVTGGTSTTLQFVTRNSESDTTDYLVTNAANSVVAITVQANRAYPLPDELFSCRLVWPVTTSGSNSVSFRVIVKS